MSVKRVIFYLTIAHLGILVLQLPLRALVVDSTYWRDFVLILIVLLWVLAWIMAPSPLRAEPIDLMVAAVFMYGIGNLGLGIARDGNAMARILDFRNYFLPFLLYFPARYAFGDPSNRTRFIATLFLLFVVLMLDPIFELAYSVTELPLRWIPWYQYAFAHGDRFIGNSESAYILPEDAPILGLQGFPHYSAPLLVALFAFVFPSLGSELRSREASESRILRTLSRMPASLYFLFFAIAVLTYRVRTHVITALVVLFILPSSRKAIRMMAYAAVAAVVAVLAIPGLIQQLIDQFVTGFVNSEASPASLGLILSVNNVAFVLSAAPVQMLFGHGPGFDQAGLPWELRLLFFTAQFGILWLLLFAGLIWIVFRQVWLIRRRFPQGTLEYRMAQGCLGMTVVYLLDAGHYMRVMNWPNLDLWIVSLALLASISGGRRDLHDETPGDSSGGTTDSSTATAPA